MKIALLPLASRIDRKPAHSAPTLAAITILLLGLGTCPSDAQTTGFIQTEAGPWDYNAAENWFNGNINGLWAEELTLTATQTVTFGSDTTLTTPLRFSYSGSFNQTLRGTGGDWTLTLGGDITVDTVATSRTVTIGSTSANQKLNIDLGGVTRTLTVTSGRTLTLPNVISNGGIVAAGGTINLQGINTYSGATTINSGTFSLNTASASIAQSDVTVNGGSLSVGSGNSTLTRAKSVTLNGLSLLNVTGSSTANSVDTVTNALTANTGAATTITVTANAARNAQLVAGSLVRNVGSTLLFRGTNLGVNSIASETAGAANISFGTAPTLAGGGGANGTTTRSILAGAYGDTRANGNGFTAAGGLVTYDADNGIRLLDTTEYKTTITDGQTQLDNVRLAGVSGTPLNIALTSPTTTVNSLSFNVTGAGTDSGVTVSGADSTTLKISSGMIYGDQSVTTPTASDIVLISVPTLDLNGREGIVINANVGQSGAQGNYNAPLQIDSVITNDGGNGLTKAGSGSLKLGGAIQNTYTGDTTLNAGILYLARSATNIAIPSETTLIVNGGALLQTNNQIPDDVDVTVNGGTWAVSNSNSNGNSSQETINNLTLTGGTVKNGQSRGGTFNILGSATLTGGTFLGVGDGSNITVAGEMSISNGATVTLNASGTTGTNFNSKMTLNGGLTISNLASGAYTPITINAANTVDRNGGQLILASDLTFVGNQTNTNTTTINTTTGLGNSGTIALSGASRWDIDNGAADVDLTVAPSLSDHGGFPGTLTKAGGGTLLLSGANTYTGETNIESGTLLVSGSLSGSSLVTVKNTGTLGGNGTIGDMTVNLGGTVSPGMGAGILSAIGLNLETGSRYLFEGGDLIDVNGTLDLNEDWTLSLGTGLVDGGSVTLFTYDVLAGSPDLTPNFNLSMLGFTPSGALSLTDTGSSIVLNGVHAIPEPAGVVMLLGGAGILACGRRFRGRNAQ